MHRWVLVSSAAAPVVLIGGWTLGAAQQPSAYDSTRDTISALAAHGAVDPWIMTTGLLLLGICHVATAIGLPEAGLFSRTLLTIGGTATILVSVFAQPSGGHVPSATVGFVALALWPAFWAGRRYAGIIVTLVLVALLIWLGLELGGGALLGLSERILAGAQALCPLGLVLAVRQRPGTPSDVQAQSGV